MYIWVGIKVEDQLKMVKAQAQRIENEIGFDHSNFTLPLHISLKILHARRAFSALTDTYIPLPEEMIIKCPL